MPVSPFDQFWAAYPRRVAKGDARKAFAVALKKTTLETMLAALAWQAKQPDWTRDGKQYIPYPATWLRAERWDDERVSAESKLPAWQQRAQMPQWRH